jgi:hypothetical protein
VVTSSKGEASRSDFNNGAFRETLAIPAISRRRGIADPSISLDWDYDFEIVATDLTRAGRNLPPPGS